MMKKKRTNLVFLASSALALSFGVTACNDQGEINVPTPDMDFAAVLESGRHVIYMPVEGHEEEYEYDYARALESNKPKKMTTTYRFSIAREFRQYATVDEETGKITPVAPSGNISFPIKVEGGDAEDLEEITWKSRQCFIRVVDKKPNANKGANYSTDPEQKTDILGQLEGFAMNNFLTGITLFENGGYIRYHDRVKLPVESYVDGYGFGLLSEGHLTGQLPNGAYNKKYLQSVTSSETYTINAWNATGSQVGDLNGYITSGFWSQKLGKNEAGEDAAVWYPSLAADHINKYDLDEGGVLRDADNLRPVPVDNNGRLVTKGDGTPEHPDTTNELGLYRRWRVYVKTGRSNSEHPIKYRGAGQWNNRPIALEDYEFVFKLLLTQSAALTRGAELASDTSYGIKGAYNYFRKTKNSTYTQADYEWTQQRDSIGIKLGQVGDDELGNGEFIEFELVNPVDAFTAMYTLSSSLYSPIPEDFMKQVGGSGNWVAGGKKYGTWSGAGAGDDDTAWIKSHTICTGPYYIERWDLGKTIVFGRNNDWYECDATCDGTPATSNPNKRYHIPGVVITVNTNAAKDPDTAYKMLGKEQIDSCAVPKSILEKYGPDIDKDLKAKGDSTFKLNVNSCTQERSDYLFGTNGVIKKHTTPRTVHPWMSNNNFLRGLFWSIKRKEFADARGVGPSYEYFADSYQSDPDNNTSYNRTGAHAKAIESFDKLLVERDPITGDLKYPYGYNEDIAVSYFQMAVSEMLEDGTIKKLGTPSNPKKLTIDIWWMYQSDIDEYGKDIKNYFKDAFENNAVCGNRLVLNVKNHAVTQWEQVYNDHLMTGDFDLGFGAISGNTLNPLNFMEVLRSDNSSKFTLNWGADTGVISEQFPINYDDKEWTYDALWAAGDHGVIASDGKEVEAVTSGYMTAPRVLDHPEQLIEGGDLSKGGILHIPFTFVQVESGVELEITRIKIYLVGSDSYEVRPEDIEYEYDVHDNITAINITISQATGAKLNDDIFEGNELAEKIKDLDPNKDKELIESLQTPFRYSTYISESQTSPYEFWQVEIYYNLTIDDGMATENVFYVKKNASEVSSAKYSALKF